MIALEVWVLFVAPDASWVKVNFAFRYAEVSLINAMDSFHRDPLIVT